MDYCANPSNAMTLEPEKKKGREGIRVRCGGQGRKNTAVVSATAARQIGYRIVSMRHPHFSQVAAENDDDAAGKGGRESRDVSVFI